MKKFILIAVLLIAGLSVFGADITYHQYLEDGTIKTTNKEVSLLSKQEVLTMLASAYVYGFNDGSKLIYGVDDRGQECYTIIDPFWTNASTIKPNEEETILLKKLISYYRLSK